MKILFFHHASTYGGSSRSLGLLLPCLAEKGLDVWIAAPDGPACDYFKTLTDQVIPIDRHCVRLSMSVVGMKYNIFHFLVSFSRVYKVWEIKKIISRVSPDIVHCNEVGLILVAKTAKKMGIKVVMHARTMPDKQVPGINRWVTRNVNKYCDHLVCISGSVSQAFSDVPRRSVIYNPLDPNEVSDVVEKDPSEVVFLSLSAIQESKGVFDIVECAALLRDKTRLKFRIAGQIQTIDQNQMSVKQKLLSAVGILDFRAPERFVKLIKEYDLDNIELLGHVSDVNYEISRADVMLAPMHLNAPPRSVYEAGAFGLPSILSMEDKVEDIVENDSTGLLIDEKNPEQLASAVLRLANDNDLRELLGAAARRRSLKNHDPLSCASGLLEVYNKVGPKGARFNRP